MVRLTKNFTRILKLADLFTFFQQVNIFSHFNNVGVLKFPPVINNKNPVFPQEVSIDTVFFQKT